MTLRCEAALLAGGSDFTVAAGGEQVKKKHIRAQYDVKKVAFLLLDSGQEPTNKRPESKPRRGKKTSWFYIVLFSAFYVRIKVVLRHVRTCR